MNGTGRGGLICIALLLFVLIGSGVATASAPPGGDVRADSAGGGASPDDAGSAPQTLLEQPEIGDTVTYHGSEDAFSMFYEPVLLWYVLGAVIVLLLGYYLVRTYRRKDTS
jgi:hypothetical protein